MYCTHSSFVLPKCGGRVHGGTVPYFQPRGRAAGCRAGTAVRGGAYDKNRLVLHTRNLSSYRLVTFQTECCKGPLELYTDNGGRHYASNGKKPMHRFAPHLQMRRDAAVLFCNSSGVGLLLALELALSP